MQLLHQCDLLSAGIFCLLLNVATTSSHHTDTVLLSCLSSEATHPLDLEWSLV